MYLDLCSHDFLTQPSSQDTFSNNVCLLYCSLHSLSLSGSHSAASAGALEFMTIYSTSNLPKLLNGAKEGGWRILGAAAEVPDGVRDYSISNVATAASTTNDDNDWDVEGDDNDDAGVVVDDESVDTNTQQQQGQQCLDLHKVETGSPTILVLGSEGELKLTI